MDRISALRKVEEALSDFEAGETDLESLERRIRAIVRTYATEFDGELTPYRTVEEGLVVVAPSRREARERARDLLAGDPDEVRVERVDDA